MPLGTVGVNSSGLPAVPNGTDRCKQQDELNRFRQNKLDRFRQDELNTLGKTPSLVISTKSRENEELSNPTCDVILPDQAVASGEIHDFPDQ